MRRGEIKLRKPNIVYIYADDLGQGVLSCYGQKKFQTPNIDRIANEGMLFTRAYATAFCAPARASLICGIHDAHAGRWTYTPGAIYKKISTGELAFEQVVEVLQHTGIEPRANDEFLGTVAQKAGYVTAEIGKLEWGFSTTPERVERHGWDYHYGYYDHIRCHGFYPSFLFENGVKVDIPGNTDPHCGRPEYDYYDPYNIKRDMTGRAVYSQDLFDDKILKFINDNKNRPFFLFHPSQLPHGPAFYPDFHPQVKDREDLIDIEKEYASMVLRLDETVGKILSELDRLDLTDNTLVIFASDNGHTCACYNCPGRTQRNETLDGIKVNDKDNPFRTETCGDTFDGNNGMAGLKFSNWDGGNKIVFMAKWPGVIREKTVSSHLISNYDTLATIADIVGTPIPPDTDGISYLPVLKGQPDAPEHEYVIFSSKNGPALVTSDGWKLRVYITEDVIQDSAVNKTNAALDERVDFQLYNLNEDYSEKVNLAELYPDVVEMLKKKLVRECDGNLYNGTPMAHLARPAYKIPVWSEIVKGII